jgi:hypothetical protein
VSLAYVRGESFGHVRPSARVPDQQDALGVTDLRGDCVEVLRVVGVKVVHVVRLTRAHVSVHAVRVARGHSLRFGGVAVLTFAVG